MNIQSSGDIIIGGNIKGEIFSNGFSVLQDKNKLIINGKEYKNPKNIVGNGQVLINTGDRLYINGYEFKNGKFKITLRSLLKTLFS